MLVLLLSFIWVAFIGYRLQNKAEKLLEDKAKELITEDNIKKVGSKFQRKMEEQLKKREENLVNRKK
jgi:hypothetical protein